MKTLYEVLPKLTLPENLKAAFDTALVSHVIMSKDRSCVKLELELDKIVARKDINALAAHIKHQFFLHDAIKIIIHEHYHLNNLTTASALEAYKDSIMQELREEDILAYNFLAGGEIKKDEKSVEIIADNNVVNAKTAPELKAYFEKVLNERLGVPSEVKITLAGDKKDAYQEQGASSQMPGASAIGRGDAGAKPQYRRKSKGTRLTESQGFGYDFEGVPMPVSEITEEMGEVIIRGDIFAFEERVLKTENLLFAFSVTDYTDSIRGKIFAKPDEADELRKLLKKGASVLIKGETIFDTFEHELTLNHIKGIKYTDPVKVGLKDTCEEKRVELHCHTKMSDMDGVSSVEDIILKAAEFGHPAIAITDHGVVHGFPDAMAAAKKAADKGKKIKVIYGCEGYLVDDKNCKNAEEIMKERMYHIILLAKNDLGRINLYRLVSEAHLTYYHKRPRIPRLFLEKYREGIIIGSACEAGELMRAIVEKLPEEEIVRRASFYDYLEVQPIGNNRFMLFEDGNGIDSEDDLRALNNKVIELGEKLGKPVVATSDVHFLNPEDEVYRRIIMNARGFKAEEADRQAPLYLHTTDEMLAEFSYLGTEKAHEIVIDNTNLIADMCEEILPVRLDKCPPVIDGSEENLRKICYEKAYSMYGDPLPEIVQSRLDTELNSIIGNGYSVMYVFAQMLVKDSVDHGYVVGSRGSVGSSFAATMADITEVNPLPPHYLCPNPECKYSEWDSEEIRQAAGRTGYDMPDKICPKCGTKMRKEGIDIPFETFLGFTGNKEPDIDLNFSGEYQSCAHAYTARLFGKDYAFRAGTIAGVADKTAYGYVKNYFEEREITKRRCEIDRLILGCTDVRRSTGQHPGGIIVMPKGEIIYSFTPVQHPANDMTTEIITTHFDYHKIEQNLLKFDILGHDSPTMMHHLQEMTGVDPFTIPIDDAKLYTLFENTDALGIKPEDMGGTPLGTLGISEFNTDFAMQMLIDAKPSGFADLVNVAGLAHGTDVWMGNARDLILNGTATLRTAICTRDGIMSDLIRYGLDPAKAFSIMESVRKGKVAKKAEKNWDTWKKEMQATGVPEWYLGSCEKIQYMFPKAHAAAYVIMAIREAFFKVYYPREFYAVYFGVRADGFDYEKMCLGKDKLLENFEWYKQNYERLTKLEKDCYNKALKVAVEMYARGFEFMPIDIYKAKAHKFRVIDGKIMPALTSIAGLGDKVAENIEAEAARAKFLSKEDFMQRTKCAGTIADLIVKLGLLGDIPESNQISLFDLELE